MMRAPPFFSIGLTAYDRMDLLRQSVSSILNQTLADFELIIGNDNPARTLTLDDIGTQDSRVRIINQPRNLGQVGNWRSLLEHATGRYFTWIADDDLYAPDFLAACHAALAAHGFPACVYSSFDIFSGQNTVVLAPTFSGRSSLGSGSDLLWGYLLDEVQLLGNMGVFARDFLVNRTPWQQMECPGVALFREYIFVLLTAKLEKVAYIPDSLILYRDHAGSWGSANVEIKDYHAAGKWLVKQSSSMLESAGDPAVREQLVTLVFNLALKQIVSKRKNVSFAVDVDELFNDFLDLPETSARELGRPDAIGAMQSGGRRFFLSLCRQYVVAETGRIEKDAEINRIAEEARQRAVAIDHLTAETAERQRLIEHLTRESGERLRVSEERRQLIERLNDELTVRASIIAKHGPQLADMQTALAHKDRALADTRATLAQEDRVLADAQAALAQKDSALADAQAALAQKDSALADAQAALAQKDRVLTDAQAALAQKDSALTDAQAALAQKDSALADAQAALAQKDRALNDMQTALALRESALAKAEIELQEKERVIQELAGAVRAFRMAHSRPSRKESLARLVSQLRAVVTPRLGNLNQHAPRELRLPKHYARSIHVTQPPRISIVTPSFKQARFIERTIRSVLDQSYPNLEYYVQDGGSEDGTTEVLERYADRLAGWESHPDSGQSRAINLGFARTSGEIMAWLNSDDILLPGALAFVADYFNRHPEIHVVYGHRVLINENDQQIGRWMLPAHDDAVLSWADYVPQETLFWRRRIWDKVGGKVDESFRFAMDWDLLLRFRAAGAKFRRLPRFLGAFRVHPHQKTSAAISDIGQQEMARIRARELGHEVSYMEIGRAILPYLLRHVATDLGYRVMNKLR